MEQIGYMAAGATIAVFLIIIKFWRQDIKTKRLIKAEEQRQHDLIRQINKKLRHDE